MSNKERLNKVKEARDKMINLENLTLERAKDILTYI
jgi:hypothetical protein